MYRLTLKDEDTGETIYDEPVIAVAFNTVEHDSILETKGFTGEYGFDENPWLVFAAYQRIQECMETVKEAMEI